MGMVSARIPDDLEDDLARYIEEENLERSVAIRRLLTEGLSEWKRQHAAELLRDGDISFNRAVEIAEMDPWGFTDYLSERDISWVNMGDDLEAL